MKHVRITLATLLLLLIEGHSIAWQITVPGAEERASFLATYPNATLGSDGFTAKTTMISGVKIRDFKGTPAEIGQSVLLQNRILLGIPNGDVSFTVRSQRDTRSGGRRVLYEVHAIGPVPYAGEFLVGVNRRFEGSPFYIDQNDNVAPPGYHFLQLGENRDYDEARDDWYVYFIQDPATGPVVLYKDAPSPRGLHSDIIGFKALVQDSAELSSSQKIISTCPGDDSSIVGSGFAYRTNPLNDDVEEVPLANLCDQNPNSLTGKRVHVESYTGEVVYGSDGAFTFQPGAPEFEDVSVYYHIDNYVAMMQDRGFDPLLVQDWSINAYTRSTETTSAVSRYKVGKIEFGIPDSPFLQATYEAAIIAHETTHNLMYDLLSGLYFGHGEKEHFEMGEAYADYFGLVYRAYQLGNARPWEHSVIGIYLSPDITQDLPRDISSTDPHYSERGQQNWVGLPGTVYSINFYDNSLIFSGALLDYDKTDGSDYSSAFVIESLFNSSGQPTFQKGRDALMHATNNCALGASPSIVVCCELEVCSQRAQNAFAGRGIGESEIVDSQETPPDRDMLFPKIPIQLEGNYPNPFNSSTRIEFEVIRPVLVHVNVFDALGRHVEQLLNTHVPRGRHFVDWSPRNIANGAYFFEIVADGFVERGSMLLVK